MSLGSYLHQFNTLGTFHYFSGYVDENQKISFRGVIEVVSGQDNELAIDVSVNDIKGKLSSYEKIYLFKLKISIRFIESPQMSIPIPIQVAKLYNLLNS